MALWVRVTAEIVDMFWFLCLVSRLDMSLKNEGRGLNMVYFQGGGCRSCLELGLGE